MAVSIQIKLVRVPELWRTSWMSHGNIRSRVPVRTVPLQDDLAVHEFLDMTKAICADTLCPNSLPKQIITLYD